MRPWVFAVVVIVSLAHGAWAADEHHVYPLNGPARVTIAPPQVDPLEIAGKPRLFEAPEVPRAAIPDEWRVPVLVLLPSQIVEQDTRILRRISQEQFDLRARLKENEDYREWLKYPPRVSPLGQAMK